MADALVGLHADNLAQEMLRLAVAVEEAVLGSLAGHRGGHAWDGDAGRQQVEAGERKDLVCARAWRATREAKNNGYGRRCGASSVKINRGRSTAHSAMHGAACKGIRTSS